MLVGEEHLSKVLEDRGYNVLSSDLIDRGYGVGNVDFLESYTVYDRDILTNAPYKYAQQFVEKALELINYNHYAIFLLKIQFLEGKARRKLFEKCPPKFVYVFSERQKCYLNGDMSDKSGSAVCYAWFIWEKGFKGEPTIRWI